MLYNSFIFFNRDLTLALQTLTGNVIPALFSKNNFYLQSFFVNSLHLWVSSSSSIRQESWRRVCLRPLASKIIGFYELINVMYYYRDCTVLVLLLPLELASYFLCSLPVVLFAFVGSSSSHLCHTFEAEHLSFSAIPPYSCLVST